MNVSSYKKSLAYIIGISLGDGNLSNPNGRAIRLRVTCDKKYPEIIEEIKRNLHIILPENKISTINRIGCIDVSCYSNKLEELLGWKALNGSKERQKVKVPDWIFTENQFIKKCLIGLFQTDGSIYKDRNYIFLNFTTVIPSLLKDVMQMLEILNYEFNVQKSKQPNGKIKYVLRINKNTEKFIKKVGFWKR